MGFRENRACRWLGAVVVLGSVLALPARAGAQAPASGPFQSYNNAALRQYGGGGTPPPTPAPAPTTGQLPATDNGTPPATVPPAPVPTAGPAPGAGSAPAGGGGSAPGGSGAAPASDNGQAKPIRVAPIRRASHLATGKGTLPFTGEPLTWVVIVALGALSLGLFLRVGERQWRRRRGLAT